MKSFTFSVLAAFIFCFSGNLNAQSSYIVSVYGDTVACDSVSDFACIVNGEELKKFEEMEIAMTVSHGETFLYKSGFNKGKIIMASDSVWLTMYQHKTLKHKLEVTNTHLYFVNRKDLKIMHEYASWYLDGAEMIVKYFPMDEAACPDYSKAITEFDEACRKRVKVPSLEARILVRAWNDCFPMK